MMKLQSFKLFELLEIKKHSEVHNLFWMPTATSSSNYKTDNGKCIVLSHFEFGEIFRFYLDKNGQLHNDDIPALSSPLYGVEVFYQHGKLDAGNIEKPAVIRKKNKNIPEMKLYTQEGNIYKKVIGDNAMIVHYQGKQSIGNVYGCISPIRHDPAPGYPALYYPKSGSFKHYHHGILHNVYGPAVKNKKQLKFYLHGKQFSFEDWKDKNAVKKASQEES